MIYALILIALLGLIIYWTKDIKDDDDDNDGDDFFYAGSRSVNVYA